MILTPAMEKFVLHWGEMGTQWGVNRSVSQIHALLYLSSTPLSAEVIAETLGIARSNVSNSLKELQSWKLITRTHVMGDRRDHFEAKTDLWEMLMTIVEGRKTREIDPTLEMLRGCAEEAKMDGETPDYALAKIERMQEFVDTLASWYSQVSKLNKPTLVKLMKMGSKVSKFVTKG
ncbi:MAG: MarR family transcriptional regulator [Proteobacteria bacterium]|nr:MarR family transcriptional regulator [Pseudomonadota bacterium]